MRLSSFMPACRPTLASGRMPLTNMIRINVPAAACVHRFMGQRAVRMNESATGPSPISPGGPSEIITAREAGTLWGLFRARVQRSPDAIAYRQFEGAAGWRDYRWRVVAARAEQFRNALARADLNPGDHVAVLLPNGVDWVCLDLAAQAQGMPLVALYPHDTAASQAFILGHSDARLLLVDSDARWDALARFRSQFPLLRTAWVRDRTETGPTSAGCRARSLDGALCEGASPSTPRDSRSAHCAASGEPGSGSPATVIYTSGSTGRPKGAVLSHAALLWNAAAAAAVIPMRHDDVFLSVLPLAHAFERTVGYYLAMMGGCTVAYARSPHTLADDLRAIRPTVLLGVPLLFERMAAEIRRTAEASVLKQSALALAGWFGWRRFLAAQQRGRRLPLEGLLEALLDRRVGRRVRAAFGGRLRVAVSGGAPLDVSTARLLIGLGVPVVEGYGLTEAAPVVATNSLEDNVPGTVGRPLSGVEVKLSGQGELLVRSPALMSGYWKDAERTARSVDAEGWLSTGDLAEFVDGRIAIRGRLKEIIVLSNGEKLNPNLVEAAIVGDPLFDQAAVIGDGRPFPVGVVVLNSDAWRRFAAEHGLTPDRPNEPTSRLHVLAQIMPRLQALPRYAHLGAVHLTLDAWTIENGVLTPTLKIKRDVVQQRFAADIAALYATASTPFARR
jgi:long-chain acyl-CoA synthetase